MNEMMREELLAEQGYTICPICACSVFCNEDCENCPDYKDFVKALGIEKEQED